MQACMPTIGTNSVRVSISTVCIHLLQAPEIFQMLVNSTKFAVYPVNSLSALRDRLPRVQHPVASLYGRGCSNKPNGLRRHILAELSSDHCEPVRRSTASLSERDSSTNPDGLRPSCVA